MMNLAQKIRSIRNAAGLNQAEFAKAVGVTQGQVSKWEKAVGAEIPSAPSLKKIAAFAKISLDEILKMTNVTILAPVLYTVESGDTVHVIDYPDESRAILAPAGAADVTVAAEVKGHALGPTFEGWHIFYEPVHLEPGPGYFGKLCMVGLEDGSVLVKRLGCGQLAGRFNLYSISGPPIYDAVVEWVSPITHMAQPD